jgi:hypothetical protein
MTPDELAQEIFDHFLENAQWPLARELQAKHRKTGNIRLLAKRLGWERGGCSDGAEGRCIVQLREIAARTGSQQMLEHFVSAIRFIAQSYIERDAAQITSDDIGSALGISGDQLRIVGGLLAMTNGIWTQGSWPTDNGAFWLQPAEKVLFFEEITSPQEFFDTEDRLNAEEMDAARTGWVPLLPPVDETRVDEYSEEITSEYLLRDKKLEYMLARDMSELRRVIQVGAWKAAAILAGSCIETLLFDLWKADEERARACFGKSWPDAVTASQLASAAARNGMISQNQEQLVTFLREWRNLVHPSAALRSPEPTEKLARTLIPIVELLHADLGRAETGRPSTISPIGDGSSTPGPIPLPSNG